MPTKVNRKMGRQEENSGVGNCHANKGWELLENITPKEIPECCMAPGGRNKIMLYEEICITPQKLANSLNVFWAN